MCAKEAPPNSAPVRSAPTIKAPSRMAPVKLAPLKLTPGAITEARSCPAKFAPLQSALTAKTQVEIESLHEQLRVRKEKQYHLLEKMQAAEESKRQAEDQVTAMDMWSNSSLARAFSQASVTTIEFFSVKTKSRHK